MSFYRAEWPCCGSVTETRWSKPEQCPFCEHANAANAAPATAADAAFLHALADRVEAGTAEVGLVCYSNECHWLTVEVGTVGDSPALPDAGLTGVDDGD